MKLNEVKKLLENLNQDDIIFDPHFYKRVGERLMNENMVRSFLSQLNRLEKIEQGKKDLNYSLK
ncbi:MAG: hypothetical protein AABX29_05555 [Nanoarchaeota archaeon]